jgi:hypothetical protein
VLAYALCHLRDRFNQITVILATTFVEATSHANLQFSPARQCDACLTVRNFLSIHIVPSAGRGGFEVPCFAVVRVLYLFDWMVVDSLCVCEGVQQCNRRLGDMHCDEAIQITACTRSIFAIVTGAGTLPIFTAKGGDALADLAVRLKITCGARPRVSARNDNDAAIRRAFLCTVRVSDSYQYCNPTRQFTLRQMLFHMSTLLSARSFVLLGTWCCCCVRHT